MNQSLTKTMCINCQCALMDRVSLATTAEDPTRQVYVLDPNGAIVRGDCKRGPNQPDVVQLVEKAFCFDGVPFIDPVVSSDQPVYREDQQENA